MNRDIATLREVIVKLTQMLAGQGLRVTQQGSSAFVQADKNGKPVRVNLPFIPDNATPQLILAIQGFLDHEVAHVLFTDWAVVEASAKMGPQYDALQNITEDTYIERAMGKKLPGSIYNLDKLHEFFITDITTPAMKKVAGDPMNEFGVLLVPIARAWSGQARFQKFLDDGKYWDHPAVKSFVDRMDPKLIARMPHLANSQECLDMAIEFHKAIYPPKEEQPESGAKGEGDGAGAPEMNPHGEASETKETTSAKSDEPAVGAKAEEAPEDKPEENEKDETDENDEGAAVAKEPAENDEEAGEDEPQAGEPDDNGKDEDGPGVASGDGEEVDDGDKEAAGASGSDGDDDDDGDQADDSAGEGEEESAAGADNGGQAEAGEEDVKSKRENTSMKAHDAVFDPNKMNFEHARFEGAIEEKITDAASRAARGSDYSIFSKDFDVMERYKPSRRYSDNMLTELEEETRSMVGSMQKDIERMMAAQSLSQNIPGYRSGRLHTAGLHKLITGDDRVFRRKHDAKAKDTVVGLLIDNSGSMGGDKMEIAMKCGYALSQTLERVGIAHEVIGFTTGRGTSDYNPAVIAAEQARLHIRYSRTEPVYMPIYKDFAERLTPTVKARFADAATNQGFLNMNIDGEAVETAVMRLLQRRERRRVLLVLSDGNPSACGPDPRQLYSHLHKVVADAKKNKVELVGIGIMSDEVKTFYPRSFVINAVEELPRVVMGELKRILTAA